ncbi:hypothetical protein [Weissella cibaria]|uniref:hypothetical protein n=1 Tax=Weissella cibaria TaxID=137591 RepID=UPI00189B5A34|nr:hypothetical protein [Weissella cibaria]
MSFVQAFFGEKFVSVMADGLAGDGKGNIISEYFEKFKVYNDDFVFGVTGSSRIMETIFDDVERLVNQYPNGQVMGMLANTIGNAKPSDNIDFLTVIMFDLSGESVVGMIQKIGQTDISLMAPRGQEIKYLGSGPKDVSADLINAKIASLWKEAGEISGVAQIKNIQLKLNEFVSSQSPSTVNNNVKTFIKFI